MSNDVWEVSVDKGTWTVKSDGFDDGSVSVSLNKIYTISLVKTIVYDKTIVGIQFRKLAQREKLALFGASETGNLLF